MASSRFPAALSPCAPGCAAPFAPKFPSFASPPTRQHRPPRCRFRRHANQWHASLPIFSAPSPGQRQGRRHAQRYGHQRTRRKMPHLCRHPENVLSRHLSRRNHRGARRRIRSLRKIPQAFSNAPGSRRHLCHHRSFHPRAEAARDAGILSRLAIVTTDLFPRSSSRFAPTMSSPPSISARTRRAASPSASSTNSSSKAVAPPAASLFLRIWSCAAISISSCRIGPPI